MNMNNLEMPTQTFLAPGDLVTVRHDIPNKPVGWIVEKVNKTVRGADGELSSMFIGMKVRWFDKNQDLQEAIISTKDLELV
jgi:hypothetical protein